MNTETVNNWLEDLAEAQVDYAVALTGAQQARAQLDKVTAELKHLELRESMEILDGGELEGIAKTSKEWTIRLEAGLDMRLMDVRVERERLEQAFRAADVQREIAHITYRATMVGLEAQTALVGAGKE